ncbi:UDP-4-amino-4-deoxy-L-arabinose N-formyltransferase [Ralstonia solanacearum UW551]|uniref:UDP-4-amino-4-deoxy-L-arabinose N-formyltransferase n=1 Tax=Ralstonia solanacearum (strain UW551) TaxID=342110 RepID=A0AB33V746_RALSU|nr:UDP-4-amino-4-deoxy-L-arabinose N-formyltransferase [Ralstonia solanacearum UW551]
MTRRAVVFAYHNVGVRCLRVLADRGIHIKLVVSHEDNSANHIWLINVHPSTHELTLPDITLEYACVK